MTYPHLSPDRLLGGDLSSAELADRPWVVHWGGTGTRSRSVPPDALPEVMTFRTSGSTGEPRTWSRTGEQLWAEAGLLADLLRNRAPDALVSFAPPRHLYGLLMGVLVPARLGISAWYRPHYTPLPPVAEGRNWIVAAIPWAFPILRGRRRWIEQTRGLSLVHSTASLPSTALDLLRETGPKATLLEIFGSTETGGVATRQWNGGADPPSAAERPWRLLPDVDFETLPAEGSEGPLTVRGPRLARAGDAGAPVPHWQMDDHVSVVDDRAFVFAGRRTRLVNVNGRRLDLDRLEEGLRSSVECADLALAPVADGVTGEHFDLLIVAGPSGGPARHDLAEALSHLDYRPRRVLLVDRIDRSETGKLRHVQTPLTAQTEGDL